MGARRGEPAPGVPGAASSPVHARPPGAGAGLQVGSREWTGELDSPGQAVPPRRSRRTLGTCAGSLEEALRGHMARTSCK
ncbi:hypothetical protein DV515_00008285, partial [Chloebia gouldiae]